MESGKHAFLVCAVGVSAHDATRVMKTFKKATGLKGETKGSLLSIKQRKIFFDILDREGSNRAVAVICSTTSAFGKWASKNFHEREIFTNMLAEICISMPGQDNRVVNVISDGGRYPRNIRPSIITGVQKIVREKLSCEVGVTFADSRENDGIQIADIIGNTVYQILKGGCHDPSAHHLCGGLITQQRLLLKETTMNGQKPSWLD